MEVFTAAALTALVIKLTSFLKYLTSRDVNAIVTQLVTWLGAWAALIIAAQADVSENLRVWGNMPLGDLDFWSLVLAGLSVGSVGSFAYDVKKSIDGTDSASEPKLLSRTPPPT